MLGAFRLRHKPLVAVRVCVLVVAGGLAASCGVPRPVGSAARASTAAAPVAVSSPSSPTAGTAVGFTPAKRGAGAALGGERRPELERQHTGRVGPVLERRARWPPIGPLDPGARYRAQTRVGDELVRTGEDRDRVDLHATKMVHEAVGATTESGAVKTLRSQDDARRLPGRERVAERGRSRVGAHEAMVPAGTERAERCQRRRPASTLSRSTRGPVRRH